MPAPEPIVRVIRPNLTPDEQAARIETVNRAVAELYIACVRNGIEWPANRKEEET